MKKSFFGYKKSEVDTTIRSLKEENEQLNATITTLNTQLKNGDGSNAKVSLLEATIVTNEEGMKKLQNDNSTLKSQIESLHAELETLRHRNAELVLQSDQILNVSTASVTPEVSIDTTNYIASLEEMLANEKQAKATLEKELNQQVAELVAATSELTVVQEVSGELERSKGVIKLLEEELKSYKEQLESCNDQLESSNMQLETCNDQLESYKVRFEEFDKIKSLEQHYEHQRSVASDISLRSFYDMSKMHNDVIDSIHGIMKDYYQYVNDHNAAIRTEMEQCQMEYRQMIQSFVLKAYEFPITLSNIESKYTSLSNYTMNTDNLIQSMNDTINKFMEDSNLLLKDNIKEIDK